MRDQILQNKAEYSPKNRKSQNIDAFTFLGGGTKPKNEREISDFNSDGKRLSSAIFQKSGLSKIVSKDLLSGIK